MIADLTSNQYYRGLNRRYDRRARQLFLLGFHQDGGFWKRKVWGVEQQIPAAVLSFAHNRAFIDYLRRFLRR